ncbi:MAG: S9 family peptidase [Alphaproteobacteria bacterium]|nr:S9 family peptidase [Alphaproteobacteria bacterium]
MMKILCSLFLCLFLSGEVFCEEKFSENTLIPRSVLLAKPDRFCVRLSRNGQFISYFARENKNVVLVVETIDGKVIQRFPVKDSRNMYGYVWCHTNDHILILQDNDGDENDSVICLNISTGSKKNLTPFGVSKSFVAKLSEYFPDEVLIENNKRDAKWFDVYRLNIKTGKCSLVYKNDKFIGFEFDENLKIRLFCEVLENGDTDVKDADGNVVLHILAEDMGVSEISHFAKGKNVLFATLGQGEDKASLVSIDLDTKKITTLFKSDKADVSLGSCNPQTFEPEVAEVNYLKKESFPLTDSMKNDLEFLDKKFAEKIFHIIGRSKDDKKWLLATEESDESIKYYLYRRDLKTVKFLFSGQPALDRYHLQKMEPVVITSRDNLQLVCYLTRAHGFKEGTPVPLVAYIHGGPWARDGYGFDKTAQLLANRGYSVLQINYRGSAGFGKKFFNAINRNLEKVRDDIIDAVQWAIDQKIADPNRIAIMGGSFGGYSTLAGLAFTPDFFSCGVDIVGPSNFISLLSSVPEYWKPSMVTWYRTAGNPDDPKDVPYLKSISPLTKKDDIKKPLLVFQGKNDPRVAKAESDQIVAGLKSRKHPVVYVLYPDEGHGFHKEGNIVLYTAVYEKFLSKFLKGWFEPISKEELAASSAEFLEGENIILEKR